MPGLTQGLFDGLRAMQYVRMPTILQSSTGIVHRTHSSPHAVSAVRHGSIRMMGTSTGNESGLSGRSYRRRVGPQWAFKAELDQTFGVYWIWIRVGLALTPSTGCVATSQWVQY